MESRQIPTFELRHVGVNMPDAQSAQQLTTELCDIFDLQPREMPTSYFAGQPFEIMKLMGKGAMGHIAMATEDVDAAVEYLAQKGVRCLEDTARRDENGKLTFIYLEGEYGGFCIHLARK